MNREKEKRKRRGEKRPKNRSIINKQTKNDEAQKTKCVFDAGAAAEKQTTETTKGVGVVLVFRDGVIYTRVRAETKFYQARIAIAFAREKRVDVRCALDFEFVSVRRKKARVVFVLVER